MARARPCAMVCSVVWSTHESRRNWSTRSPGSSKIAPPECEAVTLIFSALEISVCGWRIGAEPRQLTLPPEQVPMSVEDRQLLLRSRESLLLSREVGGVTRLIRYLAGTIL